MKKPKKPAKSKCPMAIRCVPGMPTCAACLAAQTGSHTK